MPGPKRFYSDRQWTVMRMATLEVFNDLLDKSGWSTDEEAADSMGVSRGWVSHRKSGRTMPRFEDCVLVASLAPMLARQAYSTPRTLRLVCNLLASKVEETSR